jgi:hypothetical protein
MRRGKRKGKGIRKKCIERGNISYRREGSEDRRGQKGKRGASMKRGRKGKNQKRGEIRKRGEKELNIGRIAGKKKGTGGRKEEKGHEIEDRRRQEEKGVKN